MGGMQEISARIGVVTGRGLAGNLRQHFPRPALFVVISILLVANIINIGADVGAMAETLRMLFGGQPLAYIIAVGAGTAALEVFVPYHRYVPILKWLCLALFAYVGVAFVVQIPWAEVARATFVPSLHWTPAMLTTIVAIVGTTISPYLFFWQASEEVEEQRLEHGFGGVAHAGDRLGPLVGRGIGGLRRWRLCRCFSAATDPACGAVCLSGAKTTLGDALSDLHDLGGVVRVGGIAGLTECGDLLFQSFTPSHAGVAVALHEVGVGIKTLGRIFVGAKRGRRRRHSAVDELHRLLTLAGAFDAEIIVVGGGFSVAGFECRLRHDQTRVDAGFLTGSLCVLP